MIKFITIFMLSLCVQAKTVTVMVIDGGVDFSHELLKRVKSIKAESNSYPLKNLNFNDHGSHVTGLILYGQMAYEGDKDDELCQEVEVISCQLFKENGSEKQAIRDERECLAYAIEKNVDYINMSWGGDQAYAAELSYFWELNKKGIRVVAAAGNEGRDIDKKPYYPASYSEYFNNITVVGNVNEDYKFTKASNYGKKVIKVPGEAILSTVTNNDVKYKRLSGTSMSAAIYTHKLLKMECDKMHKTKAR